MQVPDEVDLRGAIEQIAAVVDPTAHVDELARGDTFFTVVNTCPENYCLVAQPQVAPETDVIEVRLLTAAGGSDRDEVRTADASQPSVSLHLSAWCDSTILPRVLRSAVAWRASASGAGSARRVAAPANIMPLALWPEAVRPPLADADAEEAVPPLADADAEDAVVADALVLLQQDSPQERYDRILEQLETHGPLALMDMDDVRACDLTRLVEANVLETAEGDFGDVIYSMRAGAVRIDLELAHQRVGFVAQRPTKCVPWRSATKIDLNVELLRRSWTYGDTRGLNPRTLDTPMVLNERWITQAKGRLAALLGHLEITLKGISAIYLTRPQHYYLCLLELEDVSAIEALGPEVETKSDEYFRSLLLGKAPAMLCLTDGDAADEPLALPAPLPSIADAPFPCLDVARPDFGRLPLHQQLGDGRMVTIHFDALSHATRRPRALVMCAMHSRCQLDRFIHMFGSLNRTCAFLLAWHEAANRFPDREDGELHKHAVVEDSEVERWEKALNDSPG